MHAGQERWVWRGRGLAASAAPVVLTEKTQVSSQERNVTNSFVSKMLSAWTASTMCELVHRIARHRCNGRRFVSKHSTYISHLTTDTTASRASHFWLGKKLSGWNQWKEHRAMDRHVKGTAAAYTIHCYRFTQFNGAGNSFKHQLTTIQQKLQTTYIL